MTTTEEHATAQDEESTDPLPEEPVTDVGMARRLLLSFGNDMRFALARGSSSFPENTA